MSTIFLAWRNVWRNPRRTALTVLGIAIGLCLLLETQGVVNGMRMRLVRTVSESWLGDAEIHAADFRRTRDPARALPDAAALARRVVAAGATAASARALASGMAAVGDRAEGLRVAGVDFAGERGITSWSSRIVAGAYPSRPGEALVGKDLADRMDIGPASPLVLQVADAGSGDIRAFKVIVAGVVLTGDPVIDGGTVLTDLGSVQRALGIGDAAEEIVLRLPAGARASVAALLTRGEELATLEELAPALPQMEELERMTLLTILLVVAVLLALGVANTLTMALLDRIREFGVLRALGTSPWRLALLIESEALLLGLVGATLGLLFTGGMQALIARTGVPLPGVEVGGVVFHDPLPSILSPGAVLGFAAWVVGVTVVVAGFTAVRAARVDPALALRMEA